MPTIEPRHIELALDVRRGLYRLSDLKEDAPIVNYILQTTPEARLAQIAQEQHPRVRERHWGGPRQRGSLSTP